MKQILRITFLFSLAFMLCVKANAQELAKDQEQLNGDNASNFIGVEYYAQTFTAGITGNLKKITLRLFRQNDSGDVEYTLKIIAVNGNGEPVPGTVLASTTQSFSLTTTPTGHDFVFDSPYSIEKDENYAFLLSTGNPNSRFAHVTSDQYPEGAMYYIQSGGVSLLNNFDFYFITYVEEAPVLTPVFTSTPVTKDTVGRAYEYVVQVNAPGEVNYSSTLPSWLSGQYIAGREVNTLNKGYTGGYADGPIANTARFGLLSGVAIDADGNIFVAESQNHRIRKISTDGIVSTFVGSVDGENGHVDGTGTSARLDGPRGMVFDAVGNLYVADYNNYAIRKITPEGVVTTFAGGIAEKDISCVNPEAYEYWNPAGDPSNTSLGRPKYITIGDDGNFYYTDGRCEAVKSITPDGDIMVVVGGYNRSYKDGTGVYQAFFLSLGGIVYHEGVLYVADSGSNAIRKIEIATRKTTTLAGNGEAGYVDGTGTNARFNNPYGLTKDSYGNLYLTDLSNNRIRKVTLDGTATTLAGSGLSANGQPLAAIDGNPGEAKFASPIDITMRQDGSFVITDQFYRIRELKGFYYLVTGSADLSHLGSHPVTITASNEHGDEQQSFDIEVYGPSTFTYDDIHKQLGDTGFTLTDPASNNTAGAFTYTSSNPAVATVSGNNVTIHKDGKAMMTVTQAGDGYFIPTTKMFTLHVETPPVITSTPITTVKVGELYEYEITKGNAGKVTISAPVKPEWLSLKDTLGGYVSRFAGQQNIGYADGHVYNASFGTVTAITRDAYGNIFLADGYYRLRKITPDSIVTTFAGGDVPGFADGSGTAAEFRGVNGLCIDKLTGNLIVADYYKVRIVTPLGVVTTLAGGNIEGLANGTGNEARFNYLNGIDTDDLGNIYVADRNNHCIRKITPTGVVTTVAGTGIAGFDNGPALSATFNHPQGLVVAPDGTIYVSDWDNHSIRKISPDGIVSTVAGNGTPDYMDTNGPGTPSAFNIPGALALDDDGNLWVNDGNNRRIRKIAPNGEVSTVAGSGIQGNQEGPALEARFYIVRGLAFDNATGNLYIADGAHVKKMSGPSTVLAGTPTQTGTYPVEIKAENTAGVTSQPFEIHVVEDADFEVSDMHKVLGDADFTLEHSSTNNTIGAFTYTSSNPNVAVITGNSVSITGRGVAIITVTQAEEGDYIETSKQFMLYVDAPPQFVSTPVLVDTVGNRYEYKIVLMSSSPVSFDASSLPSWLSIKDTVGGMVSTFAGSGAPGFDNGKGENATFDLPVDVVSDSQGNIFVADGINNVIRKITPEGEVSTFAGSGAFGDADGTGENAEFDYIGGIGIDRQDNIYVADGGANNSIRKITPTGEVTTIAGGNGGGWLDGPVASAQFNSPTDVAVDNAGNIFVVDGGNQVIRKISTGGIVSTFAGEGNFGNADGVGASAQFNTPYGIAIDHNDNLYIADQLNHKIRKITPLGEVSTFAGTGVSGKQDGIASSATFNMPANVTVDYQGNVYVADWFNNLIRKIAADSAVTTFAGNGAFGYEDGDAATAEFFFPSGITVAPNGDIYVAEENNVIRKIEAPGIVLAGDPTLADVGLNPVELVAGNDVGTGNQSFDIAVYGEATFTVTDIIKNEGDSDFDLTDPVSNNTTGTFTYTSDNTDVASISGKTVTIGTQGTANITVKQEADGYFLETEKTFKITVEETLPVELISFSAKPETNGEVTLNWSTASERNNSHFLLERSSDGKTFELLGNVPAHGNGNSSTKQYYLYGDKFPGQGYNYYRLTQVDKDGTAAQPLLQSVYLNLAGQNYVVFPNPLSGNTLTIAQLDITGEAEVSIVATSGRIIFKQNLMFENGTAKIHLDKVPVSGVYLLSVGDKGVVKKIIVP